MINVYRFTHVLEHEFSINCDMHRKAESTEEKEATFHCMEVLEEATKLFMERFPDVFNGEDIESAYTKMKAINNYIKGELV